MNDRDPQLIEPEDIKIITNDGVPAVELPNGQILRLRTHLTVEDRFEHPIHGRNVDLDVEVDADDFAWWTLYPSSEDDLPELCIEPELIDSKDGDRDE